MQNRGMLRTGHRFYFFKTYYFEEIFKKKKEWKKDLIFLEKLWNMKAKKPQNPTPKTYHI